jgi:ankyrin repeat protein
MSWFGRGRGVNAGRTLLACAICAALSAVTDAHASSLVDAARQGDLTGVRKLIQASAGEVNTPSRDSMTPLLWAAQAGNVDMARTLLQAGADANLANRYGITPLWLAATNCNPALVALLLEKGASATAALPHGETPLMAAARAGDGESIRRLLKAGADANAREKTQGETALMWAAAEDHPDAIRALVKGGADPNLASNPLDLAPMEWLQIGMVSTVLPVGGWAPLLFAARQNAQAAALTLIEVGADPNIRDPDGLNALNVAVMNGHYDLAAALLDAGADPNVADRTGMAVLYGTIEMANLGFDVGRPRVPRQDELTAADFMRRALAHGADPNARLKEPILARYHGFPDRSLGAGATPLMRAVKGRDVAAIKLLLESGASAKAVQDDGAGVLHVLATARPVAKPDDIAAQRDLVAQLIAAGADPAAVMKDGQTPVHRAARAGNAELIKVLIEHGTPINAGDKDGRTAYDFVTQPGRGNNPAIGELLASLGGKAGNVKPGTSPGEDAGLAPALNFNTKSAKKR